MYFLAEYLFERTRISRITRILAGDYLAYRMVIDLRDLWFVKFVKFVFQNNTSCKARLAQQLYHCKK